MDNKPKYNLQQNGKDLKVYVHVVQPGEILKTMLEEIRMTLAYDDASALNMIRTDYANVPQQYIIGKRAELPLKQILDMVDIGIADHQSHALNPVIEQQPAVIKEKKVEDFINGMNLLCDMYVTEEADRETIKNILKKINIHGKES